MSQEMVFKIKPAHCFILSRILSLNLNFFDLSKVEFAQVDFDFELFFINKISQRRNSVNKKNTYLRKFALLWFFPF